MSVLAQFRRDAALLFMEANNIIPTMAEYRQILDLSPDTYIYLGDDDSLYYFNGSELEYVFLPGVCRGWVLIL